MHTVELLAVFTTALMIGFGHCIGMCGGIVIAYSTTKLDEKSSWMRQTVSHLAYSLGRITTYAIFGAIFGLIGKSLSFSLSTKGLLFIATGVLMILAGYTILGGGKFLNSAHFSISKYNWFQRLFKILLSSKNLSSFYLLGFLNGLLPCGPVYAFAIIAASTTSPLYGAIVMIIFGLGTTPALLFLGSLAKLLHNSNFRTTITKIGAMIVILYGIWSIIKGYKLINEPEMMNQKIEMMQKELVNKVTN